MTKTELMDITAVSRQSGLPASTIRYYEEKDLIRSVGRRGLRRLFDIDILEKLSLISLGQLAGFTLDEIKVMFTRDDANIDRVLLSNKADELDKRIKKLTAMRDGLYHAAKCPAPNHFECPSFRRRLNFATKRMNKKRKLNQ